MTVAVHQRKTIRDGIAAALVAAGTSAGDRVYPTRVVPWKRLELPAVSVYVLSESSDDGQTAPREYKRKAQISVEAAVKPGGSVDDALDQLALEIEEAMSSDVTFGGKCVDCTLTTTELEVMEKGDELVGFLQQVYAVTYYTDIPTAVLDDLETIAAETSLGGLQATADRMKDTVTFQVVP